MNLESPEKRLCVRNMCVLWICLNASWTVIRNAVPIILNDIDPTTAPLYLGYFISTNAMLATIISVLGGHLSDKHGRITVLLPWTIYFATTSLCTLLGDVVKSVGLLWYARTGAMSVPLTILNAMLSDFLRSDALLEAGGYIGTSQNISVLVGTLMCGVVNAYVGRGATLLIGFGLSIMTCLFTAKLRTPSAPVPLITSDERMRTLAPTPPTTLLDGKTSPLAAKDSAAPQDTNSNNNNNTSSSTTVGREQPTTPLGTNRSATEITNEDVEVEVVRRRPAAGSILTSTRLIWRDPLLRLFTLAVAITRMAAMNNNLMSVFFITRRFEWGLTEVSYLLAFASFVGAMMQWKVLPMLIRSGWVYETLVVSVVVEAIAMAALAFATTGWQLYVIHFASGVGAVSGTILNSRLSALGAEKSISGHVLGVVGFVQNGGEMFLAYIFGRFLAWSMSTFALESPLAGLPFIANGAIIFSAFQLINFANYWYGANRLPWSAASATREATTVSERIELAEEGEEEDSESKITSPARNDMNSSKTDNTQVDTDRCR